MCKLFDIYSNNAARRFKSSCIKKFNSGSASNWHMLCSYLLIDKGIACKTLVVHGPVVEKIIEAANAEDVNLIAMTSHGRGGFPAFFTAVLPPEF